MAVGARFFKTRSIAAGAVRGRKVAVNGDRAKCSRIIRSGDKLIIRRGSYEWTVVVKDVSRLRGPAPREQQLYEEIIEGMGKREAAIARMKLERPPEFDIPGRPSKKTGARWKDGQEGASEMLNGPRLDLAFCDDNGLSPVSMEKR